jgi:hypothetical protein
MAKRQRLLQVRLSVHTIVKGARSEKGMHKNWSVSEAAIRSRYVFCVCGMGWGGVRGLRVHACASLYRSWVL